MAAFGSVGVWCRLNIDWDYFQCLGCYAVWARPSSRSNANGWLISPKSHPTCNIKRDLGETRRSACSLTQPKRYTMALNLLLLLAAASTATATSLHSGPLPLRRRTNQPKDQSSLAIKAIHRIRGGSSTGGADWRFFVAGSISAALSHGYTTPIDVIKTRMQTNPELYNGSAILALRTIVESDGTPPPPPLEITRAHTRTHSHPQPPSLAHALAHAPSSSSAGALFLLQGLVPTLIGYGTEGALKFGSYEMLKPLFAQLTRSAFFNCILASCVAGAIAAVVLCPAEEVRIRMVADPDYAPNAAAALGRISREKGPFGSLGGFPAMAAKQVGTTHALAHAHAHASSSAGVIHHEEALP